MEKQYNSVLKDVHAMYAEIQQLTVQRGTQELAHLGKNKKLQTAIDSQVKINF